MDQGPNLILILNFSICSVSVYFCVAPVISKSETNVITMTLASINEKDAAAN